jgi:hypothetical protein
MAATGNPLTVQTLFKSANTRPVLLCCHGTVNVCFGSKAEIAARLSDVRFTPKSGH